jgi:hypothetical protein
LPCPADPSFVAHDRAAGGPVGPGLPGDDTDGARPRRTTGSALQDRFAADLLPEAGDSWAVEAEQGR